MSEENTSVIEAPTGLAVAGSFNAGFNAEDFRVPYLNCIQKMSGIDGRPGELVLDRRAVVVENGKKLPVTIVAIQKSWVEKVPFDEEVEARVAYTRDQLELIKQDTKYNIIPRATITLLIPHSKDTCNIDDEESAELFPFLLGGTPYQLAKIITQQVGYDNTFKVVNSFHVGNPDLKLHGQQWNLSTMSVERGKYSWFVPVLGRSSVATPEPVLAFINRLLQEGGEQ
jgi:hypothetical protein